MKKSKSILIVLCALMAIICLASCGAKEEETTAPTSQQVLTAPEVPTTPEPTTQPAPTNINRLTGQADLSKEAVGKRPVAIMVNNIKASLPQYGIYDADIMFEMLVEGGITRMMAVFGDYTKVPKLCSVRSCRYYYPIFAHGFDAVYFCFGSNPTIADPTLKKIGINYFDGTKTSAPSIFGKDAQRLKSYSTEHTAYVNGVNIPEFLDDTKTRTTYAEGFDVNAFNFVDKINYTTVKASDASSAKFQFSNSYYSDFTYNKETGTYFKKHSGKAHMDSANDKQLNYKNIFALNADMYTYDNGLMNIDWKGGSGYYMSNGKVQKITWKKPTERSMIEFFDENGNALQVNTGNNYIGVIGEGKFSYSA